MALDDPEALVEAGLRSIPLGDYRLSQSFESP